MKQVAVTLLVVLWIVGWEPLALAAAESAAAPPPSAPAQRSVAELEDLAKPIALYPDPLIAIILPAGVYPVEVVQAARFVRDTNNIPLVEQQPWDDKVKEVARFPEVVAMMDANLAWTVSLGQAFLEQPMDLMNAVQALRAKAQAAGTLKTTPQQVVTVTNEVVERTYENQIVYVTNTVIEVQPANTQVIYVPSYNPQVVYVEHHDEAAAAAVISFGLGIACGAAIWNNHCDWHYGGCYWGRYPPPPPPRPPPYPPYRPPPPPGNRPPGERPPGTRPPSPSTLPAQRWQPDQSRLRASGAPPSAQTREARGWGSVGAQPAQRPATGGVGARPSTSPSSGVGGARPATQPSYNWSQRPAAGTQPARSPGVSPAQRPASQSAGARPTTSWQQPSGSRGTQRQSFDRSSSQRSSAFSGINSGSSARSFSSRGAASRGGGFGGGGGFRGGGGGRRR